MGGSTWVFDMLSEESAEVPFLGAGEREELIASVLDVRFLVAFLWEDGTDHQLTEVVVGRVGAAAGEAVVEAGIGEWCLK